MAGQRQPIELIKMKGKKHLTKAEIEARQKTEVKAPSDKVTPPKYLTNDQKKEFRRLVKELKAVDLVSNLDRDALARLIIAQTHYLECEMELRKIPPVVPVPIFREVVNDKTGAKELVEDGTRDVLNELYKDLALQQDKFLQQCSRGATQFGLTVSSRCRLVVPKPKEESPANKFEKFVARA